MSNVVSMQKFVDKQREEEAKEQEELNEAAKKRNRKASVVANPVPLRLLPYLVKFRVTVLEVLERDAENNVKARPRGEPIEHEVMLQTHYYRQVNDSIRAEHFENKLYSGIRRKQLRVPFTEGMQDLMRREQDYELDIQVLACAPLHDRVSNLRA